MRHGSSSAARKRKGRKAMIDRRTLLRNSGAAIAALGAGMALPSLRAFAATAALPFDNGERPLVKFPQKRPMIGLTSRPPQLETPFSVLNKGPITPNNAFYVRYHLAQVALDIDHARDGEVMLAYAMNGADLPLLNGYPLRLVVPGYYGTYWVKHLNEITVIDNVFDGFWMKTAYRIPDNDCNCVEPGTAPKATIPINRFKVRSFITNVADGAKLKAGTQSTLKGIAFDGSKGIKAVAVSTDGGNTWAQAKLGADLGKYSFREWQMPVRLAVGEYDLKVRATSNGGEVQPIEPLWNGTGYLRNVVETVRVKAV